jgi:phytoene synthase
MAQSPGQAIRQGSRSFALASLFLSPGSRIRAHELYQWCRECDDLIDEATSRSDLARRISLLEQVRAPGWVDPAHVRELIAGFKMDAAGTRYQTLGELELYCFRVAGVVGLMMCPLIGADPVRGPAPAQALGKAMQLTNIARDVQADAQIERVYVPGDFLPGNSFPSARLADEPELALPGVVRLLEIADRWYEEGLDGLRWLPLRSAFAIAVAARVYQKIGHLLLARARRSPAWAFRQRTVVSRAAKLAAVLEAAWFVARSRMPEKAGHHRRVGRSEGANRNEKHLPAVGEPKQGSGARQ